MRHMAFYGYHGALAEEKALGQRFLVDITLTLDVAEAARTDALSSTTDYRQVYTICRDAVEKGHVKLIETLASSILDRILASCPRVLQADIFLRKPSVALGGPIDFVGLELSRFRPLPTP